MEHRWGYRYLLNVPARITLRDGTFIPARLRDVSITGARLETRALVPVLTPIRLNVPLQGHFLQLDACIVRDTPDGYGIEWYEGETIDLDLLLEQAMSLQHSQSRLRTREPVSMRARRSGTGR